MKPEETNTHLLEFHRTLCTNEKQRKSLCLVSDCFILQWRDGLCKTHFIRDHGYPEEFCSMVGCYEEPEGSGECLKHTEIRNDAEH